MSGHVAPAPTTAAQAPTPVGADALEPADRRLLQDVLTLLSKPGSPIGGQVIKGRWLLAALCFALRQRNRSSRELMLAAGGAKQWFLKAQRKTGLIVCHLSPPTSGQESVGLAPAAASNAGAGGGGEGPSEHSMQEYLNRLVAYVAKHGAVDIGRLGSDVPKPAQLSTPIKQVLRTHPELFRVELHDSTGNRVHLAGTGGSAGGGDGGGGVGGVGGGVGVGGVGGGSARLVSMLENPTSRPAMLVLLHLQRGVQRGGEWPRTKLRFKHAVEGLKMTPAARMVFESGGSAGGLLWALSRSGCVRVAPDEALTWEMRAVNEVITHMPQVLKDISDAGADATQTHTGSLALASARPPAAASAAASGGRGLCREWSRVGRCGRGRSCWFAHPAEDRPALRHAGADPAGWTGPTPWSGGRVYAPAWPPPATRKYAAVRRLERVPGNVRNDILFDRRETPKLIGAGGSAFRELQAKTRCEPFVMSSEGPPPGFPKEARLVILIGTEADVEHASGLVHALLGGPAARPELEPQGGAGAGVGVGVGAGACALANANAGAGANANANANADANADARADALADALGDAAAEHGRRAGEPPANGGEAKGKDKMQWAQLSEEEAQAASTIGYDAASWEAGLAPDACMVHWRFLPPPVRAAAEALGYDEAEWDAELLDSIGDDGDAPAPHAEQPPAPSLAPVAPVTSPSRPVELELTNGTGRAPPPHLGAVGADVDGHLDGTGAQMAKAGGGLAGASDGKALKDRMGIVRQELGIDPGLPMLAAINVAFEILGEQPIEGTVRAKIDVLESLIG